MSATPASHIAHAYTPNEAGHYGGRDHIVTDEAVSLGRLHRAAGDALCKPRRKFWGLHRVEDGRVASCVRCLEIAARMARHDTDGSHE